MSVRQILLGAFYAVLLIFLVVAIWLVTPANAPKLLIVTAALAALFGRIYAEVRLRRSSWTQVLRLASKRDERQPPSSRPQ